MSRTLVLVVATLTVVAVGLVTATGWPGYVVGTALAGALWVMLRSATGDVAPTTFALAAVTAVVLGGTFFLTTGAENGTWWAPGFIVAGAIWSTSARRGGEPADR